MLAAATEKIENEVNQLEESLSNVREELSQLKVALYARFGKSINLDV